MPQQDEAREQIAQKAYSAGLGKWTAYWLADKALEILEKLGYRKIDPAKLTLIGDEEFKKTRAQHHYLEGMRDEVRFKDGFYAGAEEQFAHTKRELNER